jgi:hypothetical protein
LVPPRKKEPEAQATLRYDGVEYALPFPLSPRERVHVREWTGLKGDRDFRDALDAEDGAFLAALVIVAMQRLGIAVNVDAILDDPGFEGKLGTVEDDDPPGDAAGEAAPDSTTTTTPEGTGTP